jgi:hypothetical protein
MRVLILIFLALVLFGCKSPEYIPIETVRTEYKTNKETDSIYIRDSVNVYIRGDTVTIYKEKLVYKNNNKTDTIEKTDTIPVIHDVTKIKEVNVLTWYQKILMILGLLPIIYIVIKVRTYIKNKKLS